MAIYMKMADFKGQVKIDGFKDWIELTSVSFATSRGVTTGEGGKQRESSHPMITDLTISKPFDDASSKLFADSLGGNFDSKVELKFTSTIKNKVETFLAYELSNCGVSGYALTGAGDNHNPVETISLNFTKIMVSPTRLDDKGSPVAGARYTHDFIAGKGS